ncbi:MAG: protoheme IX farnesyltransferase [Bdellovibrionaceae bacterium]|nr:protoheme IX farnesyltransferase [Pseudobdellovibrionaceae bacterium]MDW8189544.1 protoheme IX farnesyltransferase [Pseudobdellovibrionaceae bacterium]
MQGLKIYLSLTKFGIVIFVLLVGICAYLVALPVEFSLWTPHFWQVIGGLYFLASGSLALNQVQEWKLDQKMHRTRGRPIASGQLKPLAGGILAITLIVIGNHLLLQAHWNSFLWGLATVILYNGFYTLWWKLRFSFAAVLGAVPGAMPVFIGYSSFGLSVLEAPVLYMFLLLFLWQMPHFWLLAYRYQEDYARAYIPTLPVTLGKEKTLLQIGMYSLTYMLVASLMPIFVESSEVFDPFYGFLTVPVILLGLMLAWNFYRQPSTTRWLWYFMWVNGSILVFFSAIVALRWRLLLSPLKKVADFGFF